tara:strand:- start:25 stop:792 length:768 start_codon:yes stop_codon:yes gene_type:complete
MINKIYNEDCLKTMESMNDEYVDLILTSPPYDNLRDYKGYDFNFDDISKELFRVLKKDGVMVWVVGDATIKGSETATSFKQVLRFMDIGFKLHDTMIYEKNSSSFPARKKDNRYTQIFEYMFIFCKGKFKANLICDKRNKDAGVIHKKPKDNAHNGYFQVAEFSPRTNIWKFNTSKDSRTKHPAVFPQELAEDHIKTWTNKGDLVYDPFMGSGTTAQMCILNKRNYIGSEIAEEYCQMADKRLDNFIIQERLFDD